MGTNDLAKDTRARLVPGRAPMLAWLSTCVAAARIYGIEILDGVYNDLGNADGFAMECAQGVELGFDGKTLIHPNQIEPCNRPSRRRRRKSSRRARSSPPSTCRRTRARAWCRSTAAWSSACMPRWRAARWRSPRRSRRGRERLARSRQIRRTRSRRAFRHRESRAPFMSRTWISEPTHSSFSEQARSKETVSAMSRASSAVQTKSPWKSWAHAASALFVVQYRMIACLTYSSHAVVGDHRQPDTVLRDLR